MYYDYVYGKLLFNNSVNNSNRKYCLDLFFLSFLSDKYAHVYRYCVFCIRILEIKLICIYQERTSRSIHTYRKVVMSAAYIQHIERLHS